MKSFIDRSGFTVNITFDQNQFKNPTDVLIFPFHNEKIVMTKHQTRGIELPGGKIKNNETPLAAAVREVYEECGAALSSIKLIGQYTIKNFHGSDLVKSIYFATVSEIADIPFTTDTVGPVILDTVPTSVSGADFSPYIKDEVYPLTLEHIKNTKLVLSL